MNLNFIFIIYNIYYNIIYYIYYNIIYYLILNFQNPGRWQWLSRDRHALLLLAAVLSSKPRWNPLESGIQPLVHKFDHDLSLPHHEENLTRSQYHNCTTEIDAYRISCILFLEMTYTLGFRYPNKSGVPVSEQIEQWFYIRTNFTRTFWK